MDCVYILFSEKLNRFYTGATSDFDLRMSFHLNDVKNQDQTHRNNNLFQLCKMYSNN